MKYTTVSILKKDGERLQAIHNKNTTEKKYSIITRALDALVMLESLGVKRDITNIKIKKYHD